MMVAECSEKPSAEPRGASPLFLWERAFCGEGDAREPCPMGRWRLADEGEAATNSRFEIVPQVCASDGGGAGTVEPRDLDRVLVHEFAGLLAGQVGDEAGDRVCHNLDSISPPKSQPC